MKKTTLIASVLACLVLCGCSPKTSNTSPVQDGFIKQDLDFNIIAPVGAPSMAFSLFVDNLACQITTTPANISASLVSENSINKAIIFDSVTGLKLLGTKADPQYKLSRIITTGNLLVISTNHDSDDVMTNDDVIVSFGQNAVPDTAFKFVYPDITPDYYTAGVAQVAAVLSAGQYEGSPVDYVVISEPYYTNVSSNISNASIYADVNELYKVKALEAGYTVPGFPQAGLFIHKELDEKESDEIVNKFLSSIDSVMNDLVGDAEKTISYLNTNYTQEKQSSYFGYNSEVLRTMCESNNKLAFNSGSYDLSSFYSLTQQENIPSSNLYSKYFDN